MSETRFLKMDLRIEEQLWHDFHPNMIVSIQSWLMPLLLPKYAAQIEERVMWNMNGKFSGCGDTRRRGKGKPARAAVFYSGCIPPESGTGDRNRATLARE
jgi:hypothetical protein